MAQITRDGWYAVAGALLVEDGPGAFTLQRLCQRAGVTKGSFYHHFPDLTVFKSAYLAHLHDRAAGQALAALATVKDPRARLAGLVEVIVAEDLALEAAVRRWAGTEPNVAAAVARADGERHAFVRHVYAELYPHDPQRAADLTRLAEAFYVGAVLAQPPVTGEEYRRIALLLMAAHHGGGR